MIPARCIRGITMTWSALKTARSKSTGTKPGSIRRSRQRPSNRKRRAGDENHFTHAWCGCALQRRGPPTDGDGARVGTLAREGLQSGVPGRHHMNAIYKHDPKAVPPLSIDVRMTENTGHMDVGEGVL